MTTSKDNREEELDPKARAALELMRSNPGKEYTVMELYGNMYSEDEKSAHLHGTGGIGERFKEIQQWLDELCQLGHVQSRRISTSFFYKVAD